MHEFISTQAIRISFEAYLYLGNDKVSEDLNLDKDLSVLHRKTYLLEN